MLAPGNDLKQTNCRRWY